MKQVLVVDLDGTLLRSDILHETFWSAVGSDWRNLVSIFGPLMSGRAALKAYLAGVGAIDETRLPYNDEVIAFITRWREAGGRTALVTASNQSIAERVADHLGLFDDVHGSDSSHNLKAAAKAAFLADRFGVGNYSYMGDARADLPAWQGASEIITVNAANGLRASVEPLGKPVQHLSAHMPRPASYLRALRPHQWLKNLLVFLPMLTAHQLNEQNIAMSVLALIAFSMVASSVYVLNDLLDLAADRAHPRKRARPFAAGEVPIAHGGVMVLMLLVLGGLVALSIGKVFCLVLLVYFVLTMAYSLFLKQRTIIDIWVLSLLYSLRILAGAAATGIVPSVWLLAFSIFFFFSLAAVKRQAELVDLTSRDELGMRRRGYHQDDVLLIAMMAISTGYLSVLVMALYIRTPHIDQLYSQPAALLGICPILLYWISRIVMVTHRGHMHDDPMVFALKDRVSHICLGLIVALAVLGTFSEANF